jgi:hypothetical protein
MKLEVKIVTDGWEKKTQMRLQLIEASRHPKHRVWLHMDFHKSKTWGATRQDERINFKSIMGHNDPNLELC